MASILFVADLEGDRLMKQHILSHSARVSHQRRMAAKGALLENDTALVPARGIRSKYGPHKFVSNSPSLAKRSGRKVQNIGVIRSMLEARRMAKLLLVEPTPPLCFPPNAADEAYAGHEYFDFYLNNVVPIGAYAYEPFNISSVFGTDFIQVLADRQVFHPITTLIQGLMDQASSRTASESSKLLESKGKALSLIRKSLAREDNAVDNLAIMAVAFLAAVESFFGDTAPHAVHRRVLGYMVTAAGGLDSLDYNTRHTVCEFEMAWALQTGYSVIDYEPPTGTHEETLRHIPYQAPLQPTTEDIPAGFLDLVEAGRMSSENLETVEKISRIHRLTANAKQLKSAKIDLSSKNRKYSHYWEAFPQLRPNYPSTLTLDEVLQLALLQYCCFTITPSRPCRSLYESSKIKISTHLCSIDDVNVFSLAEYRCIIWVCMIAIYAWHGPSNSIKKPGQLLLDHIKTHYPFKALQWNALEDVVKQFYWTEALIAFCKYQWELGQDWECV
ncbi:hypothetical protein PV10_08375 [Exophiala mesophila]|uniref:Transcription factor domain-containing protein n=1 Tax=Exophiala mesophila TaxID=212818 RepID=A0A0D1Z1S1_EXOME|nr:uncharacterized protein PV10_08375 [Exophiala mesophila]KIV88717.1 hypothetical protein PV10_08375 [Exophiala mesophila]